MWQTITTYIVEEQSAAVLSMFFSFGRPVIVSFKQQNCVYTSWWKCNQIKLYHRVLAFTRCPVIGICPWGYGNGHLHGVQSPIAGHVSVKLPCLGSWLKLLFTLQDFALPSCARAKYLRIKGMMQLAEWGKFFTSANHAQQTDFHTDCVFFLCQTGWERQFREKYRLFKLVFFFFN